ncbi:unnamed protein product [Gemmataceae bacterium]|nr:unnamed protein product [Gemmataceae bacterium]VTU02209.1 unnamed protein product [Gemmataceae bacterium]
MAAPTTNPADPPEARGFPFATVAATLATLFAFLGLMVLAYKSPNYLDGTRPEPKPDPEAKLREVRARNDAVLAGSGAKMSVPAATAELLGKLKSEKDRLPFPAPEPAASAPPVEPKKK